MKFCAVMGKESFDSPQDAAAAAEAMRRRSYGQRIQGYRCEHCGCHHVGNKRDSRQNAVRFRR
jgi:hypothetical protein